MYIMVYMATPTNTATILNIKTDKKLKADAKAVADGMGLTLTTVVNSMLKQFVREKEITFSVNEYRPSKFLQDAIRESQREFDAGEVQIFENVEDMLADLMSKK
jgi:addiction module RelB/DinJ family antitoxin